MKMQWLGLGFLGALGWAIGCGGNVVVDEGTGGGSGGAPPGTTSSTTSSTTTGDPGTLCKEVCERFQQLQCDMEPVDQCTSGCLDLYGQFPSCTVQLDAYLQCLDTSLTSCDLPAVCQGAADAFGQCTNGSNCDGIECSGGSDGSCDCKGVCFGQELGTSCAPDPSGSLTCQCFVGGGFVGSCTDNGFNCDFQSGCCASFFFGE